MDIHESIRKLQSLIRVAVQLSSQRDHVRLMEDILLNAKELASADGGSLYTTTPDHKLKFAIMHTDSLNLHLGGSSGNTVSFPEIPLFSVDGEENKRTVVTHAVHSQTTVNIEDAYQVSGFDFSGTRDFDSRTGYRTKSVLTVPLKNHTGTVIGILQLLNAKDRKGNTRSFSPADQEMVESLASLAAVAMTNQRLISQLNEMLEGFIRAIATAIDSKSPHTGDHCRRVPIITRMIADAVNEAEEGPFGRFKFSEEELHELEIASLLHDCGKVVTPTHLIDKSSRLETLSDGIEWIAQRFEILHRDLEMDYLRGVLTKDEFHEIAAELKGELEFLRGCNQASRMITNNDAAKIDQISQRTWHDIDGREHPILEPNEIENLKIPRGTLNKEERSVIEEHALTSIDLLNNLTYPEHLANIPEIAGGHHEHMDGKGYPLGLTGDQMSIRARIVAIADVFEALTAADRPYKDPMPLSKALNILEDMVDDRHIDPDLYDVFMRERVFERFAREHLDPSQVDI